MNDNIFEQIKLFLPKYLSPVESQQLFSELKSFPNNTNFYLTRARLSDELLQGDGWHGFVVINFHTLERKSLSGVVISNSCDIDAKNIRALPVSVLFSPLVKLSNYIELLRKAGQSNEQIDSTLMAVRTQRITSIFYLPGAPPDLDESIILLDNIHSHPLQDFVGRESSKLFTLSQYGFYIYLLKLSIHFSRFQEGIRRF